MPVITFKFYEMPRKEKEVKEVKVKQNTDPNAVIVVEITHLENQEMTLFKSISGASVDESFPISYAPSGD